MPAELLQLSQRYAAAVDARDRGALLSAFTVDAIVTVLHLTQPERPPSQMVGHDEIGRIVEAITRFRETHHLLGDSSYEIAGPTAEGRVECDAHHITAGVDGGGDQDVVMTIHYDDTYLLGRDGWRIASRVVNIEQVETRRA